MAGVESKLTSPTIPEDGITNINAAADKSFQQNMLVTAKGGSISFAGRLFEYLVRFVFSIIVARVIGAEQYGLYTLGLTIVPIMSMLALMGLQTGVVAFLAPAIREKDESRILGNCSSLCWDPCTFIHPFRRYLVSVRTTCGGSGVP